MTHEIDRAMFEHWMASFAGRLGKMLEPHELAAYYAGLSAEMDTDMFCQAAQRVFVRHEWNTWPAPIEFISAAASIRRIPDAEIRVTMAKIDESRRLAPPPRDGTPALEAFAADWRHELRRCAPDVIAAEKRAATQRPDGTSQWLSSESFADIAPVVGEAAPQRVAS